MANNALRLSFVDQAIHLKHQGKGVFQGLPKPAAGSTFKVTNAVVLTLAANGKGANSLTAGGPAQDAQIDFFGGLKLGKTPKLIKLGTLVGRIRLQTGDVPLLEFDSKSQFVPDTAKEIVRSDFLLDLQFDQKTVTSVNFPIRLKLPWLFDPTATTMILGAELLVNQVSVASVAQNNPFDIPMRHTNVPDDGIPNDLQNHPLLTFHGIARLYAMQNELLGATKVPFTGHTVRVVLHQSVQNKFVGTNVTIQALVAAIEGTLLDAGFSAVAVEHDAAAQARANANFTTVSGVPVSVNMDLAHRTPFATSTLAGTGSNIAFNDTEVVKVDFFDQFVYAVSGDPPSDELGRSEQLVPITGSTNGGILGASGSNPQKALIKAIEICEGSNTTGVRGALAKVDPTDHVNLIASTICHEIGHSLGLRHSVSFIDGTPPSYDINPPKGKTSTGVMGPGSIVISSPKAAPFPAQFFGPVHVRAIKDQFL